jgi:hypothetical protein
MWGILVSAIGWIINYALGGSVIKWAVLAILWGGVFLLVKMLISFIPSFIDGSTLNASTSFFTPAIWYFFDYLKVSYGLSMVMSAFVARFLVRRIPFIG